MSVKVNDRTRAAVREVMGINGAQIERFVVNSVELMKEPGKPIPKRDKNLRIVHANPGDKHEYSSGGVGRMTGHLAESFGFTKTGKESWRIYTQTGYGAFHILGGAHTPPNPADARAFERTIKEMERSGPWT